MVPALEWGRNNEDVARTAYTQRGKLQTILDSVALLISLTINPQYTHILGYVQMVVLTVTAVGRGFWKLSVHKNTVSVLQQKLMIYIFVW